jgi:hypothetical protein
MMCKKAAEVKKKESEKTEKMGLRETRGELIPVGLREDVARKTAAEKEARTRILRGKKRKTFLGRIEIARAFNSKVPAVGVFDQDVVAKCAGGGICGNHNHYSPGR